MLRLSAAPPTAWISNGGDQGSVRRDDCDGSATASNGCVAKGTCGLPFSLNELGGGWELCFA